MIRIFVLGIIFLVVIAAVLLSLLYKAFVNFHPSRKKMKEDLAIMKAELQNISDKLVHWDKEEIGLLSLKQAGKKIKKRLLFQAKGAFTSIYDEPLIAYAYKEYLSSGKSALLYATTTKDTYVYIISKSKVEIYHNDKPLGVLKPDGNLRSAENNQPIARYLPDRSGLELPVLVYGKEVASVTWSNHRNKFNPRAFDVTTDMTPEEESVFLAMGILKLIEKTFPKRK